MVPSDRSASPSSRRWILLAEDDDTVRAMWATTLTNAGYRTIEARTGQDAFDLIRALVPHLIILDLHMPGWSGNEVLHRLHAYPGVHDVPILIVSDVLENAPPPHGLWLNIVGRVCKPVRPPDLLEFVEAALTPRSEPDAAEHLLRIPRAMPKPAARPFGGAQTPELRASPMVAPATTEVAGAMLRLVRAQRRRLQLMVSRLTAA